MNDMTVLLILGVLVVILVGVLAVLGQKRAASDRRYTADAMAAATVKAAAVAARATVDAAKVAEEARKERTLVLGCLGVLAVLILTVGGGVALVRGISEAGETARYKSRQSTLVELDFGRTVRHGQTMDMLTERAWADAYGQRGGRTPVWVNFLLAMLLVGVTSMGTLIFIARRNGGSLIGPDR